MAFHLGFELPVRPVRTLDADSPGFTPFEIEIIHRQIRKNAGVIDAFVKRIDLFVNQEKYPAQEKFVEKIRRRMFLLMEENDNFRGLLWRHWQARQETPPSE